MQLLKLIELGEITRDELIDRFGEEALQLLSINNIGELTDNKIIFTRDDRLKLAVLALRMGIDIKEVAKVLSWRDFEYFASIILKEHGYQVYNSVRVNRFEIDLLAIDDVILAIDCKHWKYNCNSMLANAIERQIKRIRLLLASRKFEIKYVIPLILTLHQSLRFIDNVPIVPIDKFDSFLLEFKGYIDSILVIR